MQWVAHTNFATETHYYPCVWRETAAAMQSTIASEDVGDDRDASLGGDVDPHVVSRKATTGVDFWWFALAYQCFLSSRCELLCFVFPNS